jgi:D,D-heptose 1,7-bisphosphate phosphatase
MTTSRPHIRQLVILAGGQGTRLKQVTGDLPKPMALIGGIPVLEHQVRAAARDGFEEVVFLTSYRSEVIESHFGDGSRWKVKFRYCLDESPLGTAGATLAALDQLDERFLLLYGDVMHDVDLRQFAEFHCTRQEAAATLLVHPNDHPQDSDLVEMGDDARITCFHGYPHAPGSFYRNVVNAGLYALTRSALALYAGIPGKQDFAKDLFPRMVREGRALYGYFSREYIKDMGTPERLAMVNRHYEQGRIQELHASHPVPAIFLDRDGTVIRQVPFLSRADQVELIEGAARAIRQIHDANRLAVLVTNQPVIARGECSVHELERIHGRMEHLLATEAKTYLDAIYYCPHHPDSGFPGEVAALKIACDCRKPNTGMIRQAVPDLNIDLEHSWMIGDSMRDWQTACNAGIQAMLVRTGEATAVELAQLPPGRVCDDLQDAIDKILKRSSPF